MNWKESFHDRYLKRLSEEPENPGLGVRKDKILYVKRKPKLKRHNKETGDLLIVWEKDKNTIEILVIELTTSDRRLMQQEIEKLRYSKDYFLNSENVENLFNMIGIDVGAKKIVFRGAALRYSRGTSFFSEGPSDKMTLPKKGGHYLVYESVKSA